MKKVLLVTVLLLVIGAGAVSAAQPREGIKVGMTLGLPFHVAAMGEYNFGVASASAAIGYGSSSFMLRLGGDYNFDTPFVNSDWGLDLYLSVGGHLDMYISGLWNVIAIGVPVTWSWYMDDMPLKIFVKAGPEIFFGGGGLGFLGSAGALYQL